MSTETLTMESSLTDEAMRIGAINEVIGNARLHASPLARCIAPLLVALDWFGAPRRLLASLPPESQLLDTEDLRRILVEQGFRVRRRLWGEWNNSPGCESLPAGSVVISGSSARVYLGHAEGSDWWHDGANAAPGKPPASADVVLLVDTDAGFLPVDAPQTGWLGRLFLRARRELGGILFISLIANLLALVISLFTMFIYNTVIPSGATGTLWAMTGGAILAVIGAWGLRLARIRLVSRLTAWAGLQISETTLAKTLSLPLEVSSRMGVENNLIRLRSLEGVRQWFGGAGGAVNADYPFILVFLIVIALLGGWIVFVPLVGLLLFALVAWPLAHLNEARSHDTSRISRRFGEASGVVIQRLRVLRGVHGTALWNRHLADLVAQSVTANRDYALANALSQTVGQAIGMLIVLGTMGVGVALVLAGDMNTGGLIATMMLIWRVTTPAQQMFGNQVRVRLLVDSNQQLDRLLASAGEHANPKTASTLKDVPPVIEADRLYYRYGADREPALGGVSFQVEAGQVLAIVGPNGAGKSTLLELLAGIRPAHNGRVRVAGRDIRQFDPADFRAWHGYLPQVGAGLPVMAAQALRARAPAASDADLERVMQQVAGDTWWRFFAASNASEALHALMPSSREDRDAVRCRRIVRLAVAIIGAPALILLDDPLGDRDPALDPHLHRLIGELRGRSTIVIATHRPDLIQQADLIAVLNDGALAHFGPVAPQQPAQA